MLMDIQIFRVSADAAAQFDRLRQIKRLKKLGRADLLIGYITLAHRATLVTRNDDHFRQIPGLKIENWVD
jgi:tRNA(fMet)-specific endonuclease VapC